MHREDAQAALQELKNPRLTRQEQALLRHRVIDAAGSLIPELSQALEHENDTAFRNEVLGIIGASGLSAFEVALRRLINDADAPIEVRQTAATNLGMLRSSGSFALLTELLDDASPHMRLGAIYGLLALGDDRAVQHLAAHLEDDTPVKAWWAAPQMDGYIIAREAARAIDQLTNEAFKGDQARIGEWIRTHLDEHYRSPSST